MSSPVSSDRTQESIPTAALPTRFQRLQLSGDDVRGGPQHRGPSFPPQPQKSNFSADTEKWTDEEARKRKKRKGGLFGSPAGISRPTPLHPNQQQLKAWIFLAWNQICSLTPVPGRLWKKKQPPHHYQTPSSEKKRKFNCVDVLFKKRSRGYGNCKGTDFFLKLKMDAALQT